MAKFERIPFDPGAWENTLDHEDSGQPISRMDVSLHGLQLGTVRARRVAVEAISDLAFKTLRCAHLEIVDPYITTADIAGLGFKSEINATVVVDLTPAEEAILANMTRDEPA